jgi:hypothetical protein
MTGEDVCALLSDDYLESSTGLNGGHWRGDRSLIPVYIDGDGLLSYSCMEKAIP